MERGKPCVKRSSTSGESLIEAIVSFFILVLVMTAVTTMVQVSISFKQDAQRRIEEIETNAAIVEVMGGDEVGNAALTMTIDGGDPQSLPVKVYYGGDLYYFVPDIPKAPDVPGVG